MCGKDVYSQVLHLLVPRNSEQCLYGKSQMMFKMMAFVWVVFEQIIYHCRRWWNQAKYLVTFYCIHAYTVGHQTEDVHSLLLNMHKPMKQNMEIVEMITHTPKCSFPLTLRSRQGKLREETLYGLIAWACWIIETKLRYPFPPKVYAVGLYNWTSHLNKHIKPDII